MRLHGVRSLVTADPLITMLPLILFLPKVSIVGPLGPSNIRWNTNHKQLYYESVFHKEWSPINRNIYKIGQSHSVGC